MPVTTRWLACVTATRRSGGLHGGAQSRTISPDSTGQDLNNPQTFNRFSYCLNNPLKYTDPSGNDQIITTIGEDIYEIRNGAGTLLDWAFGIDQLAQKMQDCEAYSRGVDLPLGDGAAEFFSAQQTGLDKIKNVCTSIQDGYDQFVENNRNALGKTSVGKKILEASDTIAKYTDKFGWLFSFCTNTPEPEGLGSSIKEGFSHAPRTIGEQLIVEQAKADPAAGHPLKMNLNDPRWPSSAGWQKYEMHGPGRIQLHYVYNPTTGGVGDFKIIGR
jgi:hypothetical protein